MWSIWAGCLTVWNFGLCGDGAWVAQDYQGNTQRKIVASAYEHCYKKGREIQPTTFFSRNVNRCRVVIFFSYNSQIEFELLSRGM
jgi:hypothetical protein